MYSVVCLFIFVSINLFISMFNHYFIYKRMIPKDSKEKLEILLFEQVLCDNMVAVICLVQFNIR